MNSIAIIVLDVHFLSATKLIVKSEIDIICDYVSRLTGKMFILSNCGLRQS